MAIFGKLFTIIALLSLVAFANPTGYSYIHYALNYDWAVNTESGFMALLGGVLLCIILFFFWSSWRTTEFVGKFIFVIVLALATFIAYTMQVFSGQNSTAWFVIAVLYLFFFWGMFYPRLKYSMFKTRTVDDADTE
ncbi:DUF6524 family protein [Leucothrix mucor]|uniref:DUF6524 family protein n=1 Tax=Leucothrix mucor TaxID=45248 RepID=UPI0003B3DD27|nr:DUF6524 family protein [Leucothrix mucor]